jgi:hypothetical protein
MASSLFPEQQEPPDDGDELLAKIEAAISSIERRQRSDPSTSERLATLRGRAQKLIERIDKAVDRERFARWSGRRKSEMSLAEQSKCVAEIGSRRFLEELPE